MGGSVSTNGRSGPLAFPIFYRYFDVANAAPPTDINVVERLPVTSADGTTAGTRRASTGGASSGKRKT